MKRTTTRRGYSLEPQAVNDRTWFYEDRRGLLIVRQVFKDEVYTSTEQFMIPWRRLEPSFKRYRAVYGKPDANGWIKWEGGECPVNRKTIVQVRLRSSASINELPNEAGDFVWNHHTTKSGSADIIAYRLARKAQKEAV